MSEATRSASLLRVMIVEDEYFIADDLAHALTPEDMSTIGPISNREGALAILAAGEPIDAAILDVNLGGDMVFDVASAIVRRGIPFAFATGYDAEHLTNFRDVPHVQKPFEAATVARALRAKARRV